MKNYSIPHHFSVRLVLLCFLCSSSCSGYTLYGSSQNITSDVETFAVKIDTNYKNETFLFNDLTSHSTWAGQQLATFDQYRGIYIFVAVAGSATYLFQVSIALNQPLKPVLLSKDENYEVISLTWSIFSDTVFFTVINHQNESCTLYSFSPYSLQVKEVVDLLSIGFQTPFAFIGAAHYYYYGVNCEYNQSSRLYSTSLLYFPLNEPSNGESFPISIEGSIPTAIYFDLYADALIVLAVDSSGDYNLFQVNWQDKNTTFIAHIVDQLSSIITAFDYETSLFYIIDKQQTIYGYSTQSGFLVFEFTLPLPLVNVAAPGSYGK